MSERRGGWCATYTGMQFWPLDPRPEDICIEDIAHALALQCRFNGHEYFEQAVRNAERAVAETHLQGSLFESAGAA